MGTLSYSLILRCSENGRGVPDIHCLCMHEQFCYHTLYKSSRYISWGCRQ